MGELEEKRDIRTRENVGDGGWRQMGNKGEWRDDWRGLKRSERREATDGQQSNQSSGMWRRKELGCRTFLGAVRLPDVG